jgi:hypothetical protein
MHVQAVREQQAGAGFHVRRQHLVVQLLLHHVRRQHGDQVGVLHGFGRRLHHEAIGLRLGFGGTARAQTDDDVEAGFAQVQRVRAALAAVADDRDALDGDAGLRERVGGGGHCGGFLMSGGEWQAIGGQASGERIRPAGVRPAPVRRSW